MYQVIIVGGGPVALAAAVYAHDKQLEVLVISEELGGKSGLPQAVAGEESLAWQVSAATVRLFENALGAQQKLLLRDRVVDVGKVGSGFAVTTQRHGVQEGRTVIIATGVTPLTLDVPGGRQWLGYGIGYSPTTYAHRLHDKTVVVIGTTRRALRGALELARTAKQVYLLLPTTQVEDAMMLATLGNYANVSILRGYQVTEVFGTTQVERIAIVRDDEHASIPADAVFVDLGLLPHSEMVRRLATLDPDGFIHVDAHYATNIPGLFAAGDVSSVFSEHIIVALGDGTRAATSAYDYLLAQPTMHGEKDHA